MSVEHSESRRFKLNVSLSFSQADLGPKSGQDFIFRFFQVWNFFCKICAHSERYRNITAGIFKVHRIFFTQTSRFHLVSAFYTTVLALGQAQILICCTLILVYKMLFHVPC